MYVQRLVSFKFPRPQITVVTSHPCYDTVTLNQLTGSRPEPVAIPSHVLFIILKAAESNISLFNNACKR